MTVVADARRFAEMHALYRMYDERGRLLYVGITGDLAKRLGEHSVKRWYPLVDTIRLEWKDTRAAATLAEKRAIEAERPRYNIIGTRGAKGEPPRTQPAAPCGLLADLGQVVGQERVRLSALAHLLREVDRKSYRGATGTTLKKWLDDLGVRTIRPKNIPMLDPADLRVVARKAG